MKDAESSTGAGTTRDGDDVSTDPALSSHTFTGSADRVALRITPAHGNAPPGSVEIIDAASNPVGTTAPPAEIVIRQLYPDTVEPTTSTQPPLPGRPPLAHAPGRVRGRNRGLSRWAWFGIAAVAAIVGALLIVGFLVLRPLGRSTNTALPAATAPALVGAPATPAPSLTPTLAPLPSPVPTTLPTAAPLTSTLTPPTAAPLPTSVPTAPSAPTEVATAAPTAVPDVAPTVAPPTSVPSVSSPPAVAPAAQGGAAPAAPGSQPAIPPLPPGIRVPPTIIPQAPQLPRKP